MAEIRDFLSPMNIPNLNDSDFASEFQVFCESIRDNINKIVSAPFLKGDRGSKVSFINEHMKIDGQWSEFAKNLIRAIYKTTDDMPLPLMEDGKFVDPIDNPDEWKNMIDIDGGCIESGDSTFYSFQMLMELETIPVCYDEATGKKFLCVPFYFFDGRLNYVGYIEDTNLSLFHDMSCTVFGKAEYTGAPTKEDLENPNNWDWEMETTNALPKLYYNTHTGEFCWEVSGEQTNISAQGVKGANGEDSSIWICDGHRVNTEIFIDHILHPETGIPLSNISTGDLVMVTYTDPNSQESSPEHTPYYRVQFGTAHTDGTTYYINYVENSEIIHKLRNYSLHDYLRSIGVFPNPDDSTAISALYTLERDTRNIAMAMWAGTAKNHYIAPIGIGKTTAEDTETNPSSDRVLNILYNLVKFRKTIEVSDIKSANGLNTSAISTLQSITGDNLKEYRLAALCNVLGVNKSDTQTLCRMGEGGEALSIHYDAPTYISPTLKSTGSYLYMECEIILGWVPTEIVNVFGDNLSSNFNNPALPLYRAQKYHIYVKIPVVDSNGIAEISLDGRSWSNSITLSNNSDMSYKGYGNAGFTISIGGLRFTEYTRESIYAGNLPAMPNRMSGWKVTGGDDNYEFYYEYMNTHGGLRKDKVRYNIYNDGSNRKIKWYLNQYAISGGALKIQGTGANPITISNLLWFGSKGAVGNVGESKAFPLINERYSFLGYFKKSGQYVTTTNNTNNYMWQGRVLSGYPISNPDNKQNLYYINTSFYETIYPSDSGVFIIKNPDDSPYDSTRHISNVPINSAVHIYPEGMCGLEYDRVPITSNNSAWNVTHVNRTQLPDITSAETISSGIDHNLVY